MSNYKTHNSFNILFLLPLAAVGVYLYMKPSNMQLIVFVSVFLYATFFMSPDMDIANKIKWFSLRGLFSIPFKSYALLFKHRGISHNILFGTLTRILWLFGFCAIILFFCDVFFLASAKAKVFYKMYKIELFYAFLAVFLADIGHIFLDRIKKRIK
ncbi:hypothetical protein COB11_00520 [Candidatus Aerophobetes bacterium]|uniref:Metal-binding protein n=1 Tax=Aerophobetes bacterium TaxID=2030807 RepID=A0A2A4YMF3_UNCAE|nr:MAG: hypothetical protein COB11_00520 [Candidatus Aerophobetes bacterium]